MGPDPAWKKELPRIIFFYYRKEHKRPPLRLKENNADNAHLLDIAMSDFAKLQNIRYISSLDILCNQDGCLTRTGANSIDIMTMDNSHLTAQGAGYEAKFILMDLFKSKLVSLIKIKRKLDL
jgi:hypothetical protein